MHRRRPPIVADVDGRIVGFVSVGPTVDDEGDGELYALFGMEIPEVQYTKGL